MLSVTISFLYIAITTFLLGFGVRLLAEKWLHYTIQDGISLFFAGLGVATVYAGIYSLFTGVSVGANVLLVLICIAIAFAGKKELVAFLKEMKQKMTPQKLAGLFLLVLIFAYGTSRGYLHFDSGLYHAQSIRWIEEYGVVPGLGNLHCRLAYNSSAFLLTALYSMAFLFGQSLHTVAGFMALLLATKGFSVVQVMSRKKVLVSDFIKVSLLFYISIIYTEMMSPASDYFAMLFLFYILLQWVELEEKQEKNITPYSLLCVLLAVTITIKLSAAIMLLLVIKPAVVLIKEKRYGQIAGYLALGILAVFPYLARNVILSGWLIYPFPVLDFFSFDWKIPVGEVSYDAEEIKVYAKGMTDVLLKDTPMNQWLPNWFRNLKGLEKIWVLGSISSIPLGILFTIKKIWKKETNAYGMIFLQWVLIAGYLFWQLGTPLVRYGYIYILAFPFFTVGLWFVDMFRNRKKSYILFGTLLLLFFVYKGGNLVQDILRWAPAKYYIWQQDYVTLDYDSYQIDGETFYVPLESGQIGYDAFPSAPYVRDDVKLRGTTLKEGFQRIQ